EWRHRRGEELAMNARHALAAAAEVAGHAPSIHNTQPWRWVVRDTALELHAQRERQLHELDPDGHMLLISCGAALQHACVALTAEGWSYELDLTGGEPLAVIRLVERRPVDGEAMRHFQA